MVRARISVGASLANVPAETSRRLAASYLPEIRHLVLDGLVPYPSISTVAAHSFCRVPVVSSVYDASARAEEKASRKVSACVVT